VWGQDNVLWTLGNRHSDWRFAVGVSGDDHLHVVIGTKSACLLEICYRTKELRLQEAAPIRTATDCYQFGHHALISGHYLEKCRLCVSFVPLCSGLPLILNVCFVVWSWDWRGEPYEVWL
jgi:hypothetical protein